MTAIGFMWGFRSFRFFQFIGLILACGANPVQATEVALAGIFPGKALLVINNGAPRSAGVGSTTAEGVRVIAVDGQGATLEFDGRRHRLVVGEHAVSVATPAGAGAPLLVIQGDSRGHFNVAGAVNGVEVRFLVDTGATSVALGRSDALRAGIEFVKGESLTMQTANGLVRGWVVSLDRVRAGSVTLRNVPGVVIDGEMPYVLLGMSFLNRMDMRREGGALHLRQRY
ncbi:MAG: TIGR02281 family clan AA aspartic protease [Zoogloea sp.]|uniref:retropepsin-like aspartic protease family protein n=1 Tax=Zoogloea sp. TaxID=49181 RepID=UPI002638391F|nr:TIGR02281 family clan AA aspartic protease [Zoogloea sp.]MDD2991353.1 TIGR02281 family clan AA aspartic protease [Zoogloea sp.]